MFMGRANANVARMVVDEINTNGGLLGRKIELNNSRILVNACSPR
jgi:hypothetical protein